MTDLPAIIARLEASDGPDRELDKEIAKHVLGAWIRATTQGGPWRYQMLLPEYEGVSPESLPDVPEYTSSLDACAALQERVLPGYVAELLTSDRSMWRARVWNWAAEADDEVWRRVYSYARAAHIAWLIAILRAVEAERARGLEGATG